MSKHTSGPWHVTRGWQGGTVIRSISPNHDDYGKIVVEMESSGTALTGREEAKANDRLIAAAPDLLAALESMLVVYASLKAGEQEWQHYEQDAVDARAAIAQAGGAK